MNVVDKMAMVAHNGVNRKGPGNVPYIAHHHAVVAMLKEWGYTEQDDAVTLAVAWGHDVLEDTDTTESAILSIDEMLGERILVGIKMLTFMPDVPSGHPGHGRLKADYIANVAQKTPPGIVVVKIADRLCNTLDFLAGGDAEYARAYLGYGEPLVARIKDCKHADMINASWHFINSRVLYWCLADEKYLVSPFNKEDKGEGMCVVYESIGGYWKPRWLLDSRAQTAVEFMGHDQRLCTVSSSDVDWVSLDDAPTLALTVAQQFSFRFPSYIARFSNNVACVK